MTKLHLFACIALASCATVTVVACGTSSEGTGDETTSEPGPVAGDDDGDDDASPAQTSDAAAGEDAGATDAGSLPLSDGATPIVDAAALDSGIDATVDASMDAGSIEEPPGPAVTRFIGRWNEADGTGPTTSWPGSRVVARFEGTQVSASFDQLWGFAGGTASFDVLIDDVFVKTIALNDDARKAMGNGADTPMDMGSFELANGLAAGKHKVELVKRTEANLGRITRFKGFTFAGGTQLAPPVAHTRRIEYMGDSTLDGYGVESGGGCGAYPYQASHNARRSFTQVLADSFGADAVFLGYSGKGVVVNESVGDTYLFPQLTPWVLPDYFSARVAWDFSAQVPDVVLVSLGGTDYAQNRTTFNTNYGTFVDGIRAHYASAHIYLLVGPQIQDNVPGGYNTRTDLANSLAAVKAARAGDAKLHVFSFAVATTNVDGCAGHPNATLHAALATQIRDTVQADLGW